jgi:heme O synthase-like polyprenyltransferase
MNKSNPLIQSVIYTLIALILFIIGFKTSEWFYFVGAVIVGFCAFYWIWKSLKNKQHYLLK